MLRNLKEIFSSGQDSARLLGVAERLVILLPDAWEERRDRGLVHAALGAPLPAMADLAGYLEHAPDAPDRPAISEAPGRARRWRRLAPALIRPAADALAASTLAAPRGGGAFDLAVRKADAARRMPRLREADPARDRPRAGADLRELSVRAERRSGGPSAGFAARRSAGLPVGCARQRQDAPAPCGRAARAGARRIDGVVLGRRRPCHGRLPSTATGSSSTTADAFDEAQQHAAFSLFVDATRRAAPWCSPPAALPPVDLAVREDLRTRLGWGHVFALEPLAEPEVRAALRREADRRGTFLSDEVMDYLLTRFARDLKHLMAPARPPRRVLALDQAGDHRAAPQADAGRGRGDVNLCLFDLDHTLLPIDSDHAWGEFMIELGWVDGAAFRRGNDAFYAQYRQGRLDIDAYIAFAMRAAARAFGRRARRRRTRASCAR